jgi:hypothetical protein
MEDTESNKDVFKITFFFSFGATGPICTLAYLHETLRFTSVY